MLLVLATTFSFAGSDTTNIQLAETEYTCVTVHTSCGITGVACGKSIGGLIDAAIDLDDWMCGE
ncbi:MAG: hypothetical protein Q8J84_02175 [Flavobacteriaceae bacterium]|nr:hypothetical protein [Flavobacteriaceae bacterium]